jgi:hypothetical protein
MAGRLPQPACVPLGTLPIKVEKNSTPIIVELTAAGAARENNASSVVR